MRPIDFCTPKPFNSSTRANSPLPSAAILGPCQSCLSAPLLGDRTRAEPCGSCSFTRNVLSSRYRFARPRTCEAGIGQLGPTDANEAGESRGSQRDPHFDDQANVTRGRCLPSCEIAMTVSDTPVASSALVGPGRSRETQTLARRPPRPVPRGPCERRALSRSEVPSTAGRSTQPARTEMRTNLRCSLRGRGAHVMRIRRAPNSRQLSPGARPRARASGSCLWMSPRSRAPE